MLHTFSAAKHSRRLIAFLIDMFEITLVRRSVCRIDQVDVVGEFLKSENSSADEVYCLWIIHHYLQRQTMVLFSFDHFPSHTDAFEL
jgi:hypothetical protein